MDTSLISLILGIGALIFAFIEEGGSLGMLLSPTAAIIVFIGTIAVIGVSFPFDIIKKLPKVLKIAFTKRKSNIKEQIEFFKEVSMKTRKHGLLSLENDLTDDKMDPFIRKGLQMVVDGVEPSTIKGILEIKLEQISERHHEGAEVFEAAGGYAPSLGIIGTVMGLVQILSNLDEPSTLGSKIAAGFIATLYGVASANIIWLPIGNKLKMLNKEEMLEKEMAIEAILLIQEGANPNTLVAKLESYLTEKETEELSK